MVENLHIQHTTPSTYSALIFHKFPTWGTWEPATSILSTVSLIAIERLLSRSTEPRPLRPRTKPLPQERAGADRTCPTIINSIGLRAALGGPCVAFGFPVTRRFSGPRRRLTYSVPAPVKPSNKLLTAYVALIFLTSALRRWRNS